jgi:hypothetical protein
MPEPQELPGPREISDRPDPPDRRVTLDPRDRRAEWDRREPPVLPDPQVRKDRRAIRA